MLKSLQAYVFLNLYTKSLQNSGSERPCCRSDLSPTMNFILNRNDVYKIWKRLCGVYGIDNPDLEVEQLSIISNVEARNMTRHSGEPNVARYKHRRMLYEEHPHRS